MLRHILAYNENPLGRIASCCVTQNVVISSIILDKFRIVSKRHINGLVQERRNSSALAMELRLSCTKLFNSRDVVKNIVSYLSTDPSAGLHIWRAAIANSNSNYFIASKITKYDHWCIAAVPKQIPIRECPSMKTYLRNLCPRRPMFVVSCDSAIGGHSDGSYTCSLYIVSLAVDDVCLTLLDQVTPSIQNDRRDVD